MEVAPWYQLFNRVDAILLAIVLAFTVLGLRRGIFSSLFDVYRLSLAYLSSLILYQPVLPLLDEMSRRSTMKIALAIQMVILIIVWLLLGKTRGIVNHVITSIIGRTTFTYRFLHPLGILPGMIIGLIVAALVYPWPLTLSPLNDWRLLAGQSLYGRKISPHIYSANISFSENISFAPYNRVMYSLTQKPVVQAKNSKQASNVLLVGVGSKEGAEATQNTINQERIGSGLAPVVPLPIKESEQEPAKPSAGDRVGSVFKLPFSNPTSTPKATQQPQSGGGNVVVPTTRPVVPSQAPQVQPTRQPAAQQPQPTATAKPAPATTTELAAMEDDVARRINEHRGTINIAALRREAAIDAIARAHAKDQATRCYSAHVSPEGVTAYQRLQMGGLTFTLGGEIINIASSNELAMITWLKSKGHKDNIEHTSFTRYGVGISQGCKGFYYTINFVDDGSGNSGPPESFELN